VFYLDTSAMLKLLWPEPESEAVLEHVTREDVVVVSELAELETEVQLRAAWLAGRYREAAWRRLRAKLAEFRETEPFAFRPLPGSLFQTAFRQHHASGRTVCRTLDRLHLAAMEELDVNRLMTHDTTQAHAARALGFNVLIPGRSD
jgi:predicted nucleic acid-binding protein